MEWDAVLEQWHEAMLEAKREGCFAALAAAKAAMDELSATERDERYLKTLKGHSTRAVVLGMHGKTG